MFSTITMHLNKSYFLLFLFSMSLCLPSVPALLCTATFPCFLLTWHGLSFSPSSYFADSAFRRHSLSVPGNSSVRSKIICAVCALLRKWDGNASHALQKRNSELTSEEVLSSYVFSWHSFPARGHQVHDINFFYQNKLWNVEELHGLTAEFTIKRNSSDHDFACLL